MHTREDAVTFTWAVVVLTCPFTIRRANKSHLSLQRAWQRQSRRTQRGSKALCTTCISVRKGILLYATSNIFLICASCMGSASGSNNHEKAARDFLMCIADVIRMEIIEAARSSPCLGLMVDESTDVSKTGASVMYLRLLFRGYFRTLFWRIVQVVDGSAEGLFHLIPTQFESDGIPKWLLFSFASDGASVMTGGKSGVAVRLVAAFNLHMLTCHCIAHRHALACASAAEGNAICSYFEAILADVIGYHSHSVKRHEHLEKLQTLLGVHKLRMVRLVATRWLSRGAAVHRVFEVIAALIMEFQEDERDKSNALAGPLVDATKCAKFMICLVVFNDILHSLCQLSMAFQADHVQWPAVLRLLSSTREALNTQYISSAALRTVPFEQTPMLLWWALRPMIKRAARSSS